MGLRSERVAALRGLLQGGAGLVVLSSAGRLPAHILLRACAVEFNTGCVSIDSRLKGMLPPSVLDFSRQLSEAFVRILYADVDVVSFGELGDEKSVKLALDLVLAGHLVLATCRSLHVEGAVRSLSAAASPTLY